MIRRFNTFGGAWEIQQWRDSWIDALWLPLDLRLKTEVCAIALYHSKIPSSRTEEAHKI